jgi:hypothetical protein
MSTEKGNILTLDDIFKSDSEDEEPLVEQIVAREVEPAPKVEDLDMKLLREFVSVACRGNLLFSTHFHFFWFVAANKALQKRM